MTKQTRHDSGAQTLNGKGHTSVSPAKRRAILAAWQARERNFGTVTEIARTHGISHVTVSNIIQAETGKRPRFHPCPAAGDDGLG